MAEAEAEAEARLKKSIERECWLRSRRRRRGCVRRSSRPSAMRCEAQREAARGGDMGEIWETDLGEIWGRSREM